MRISRKLVFVFVVLLSPLTSDVLFGHGFAIKFGVLSETNGGCILYDTPGAAAVTGSTIVPDRPYLLP